MRLRTTVTGPETVPSRRIADDLDYLAARLHGRRSRMAEGERLAALCRIGSLSELVRTFFPGSDSHEILDFQRLAVYELAGELSGLLAYLSGPGADLLHWMLIRFQVENLKILIRLCLSRRAGEDPRNHLVPLPAPLALDHQAMAGAGSLDELASMVPKGPFRKSLQEAVGTYGDHRQPFFFEAVLDHEYLQGLVTRAGALPREDQESLNAMVAQEADIFHLMLVVRGRFHYRLSPEALLPLHVPGTRISRSLFADMLNDQDPVAAAGRAAGRVFDAASAACGSPEGPAAGIVDVSGLERLAWRQYLLLANLAFRRSHVGLGAVIGYTGLRRIEAANLITISEGIRKGMAAEAIRVRLIAPADEGGAHV